MRNIVLTVFFTVLCVNTISADSKNIHELSMRGIELSYNLQFEQADKVFDEIIRMEPKNALGYFLKSASYYWMFDYYRKHGEKFKDISYKAIDVAKEMLDNNKNDIDALFYLGGTYGNLGRYYGIENNWLKAYWYGRKGKNYLVKVVEKDPNYYDAYVGLGVYHYFADVVPKFVKLLSFLLGIEGDREKSIDELTLASLKGNLSMGEAKYFLAYVYRLENNHEAALPLLKDLASRYPNNLFHKRDLADSLRDLKKYDLSVQVIEEALQTESPNDYPNFHCQLYYRLGKTYSEINEYGQAVLAFKNAFSIPQYKPWSLFNIGDCYEMMGEIDKAHEYYSKIKESDDKNAYKSAQARIKNPLTPAQIN